uniref:Uncharacterized protein n=1 Tax=Proboscia inermis TaxID=420281 RepID=A0A7S0GFG8_9STRA|mmetsp:Transcript_34831/g.35002  ORF Transcript_34831/g.35002 Transcript_34831/m.35002 type:complete len:165 (+) Transcript_34831:71-565(+)
MMMSTTFTTVARLAARQSCLRVKTAPICSQQRTFINGFFGLGDPDNKIPTDKERRLRKPEMPKDMPESLRKDMEELGMEGVHDLDEAEEHDVDGFQEAGLVPPEDAGTFQNPILIPSRLEERQVGYTDPVSHAVFWFNIQNDGNLYFIKDLGLFFKVLPVADIE